MDWENWLRERLPVKGGFLAIYLTIDEFALDSAKLRLVVWDESTGLIDRIVEQTVCFIPAEHQQNERVGAYLTALLYVWPQLMLDYPEQMQRPDMFVPRSEVHPLGLVTAVTVADFTAALLTKKRLLRFLA